jgi:pimeloyl-ACP methyl ester carboxylesterase
MGSTVTGGRWCSARFLRRQGYAVLLIDLPGQGASTASAVTFGLREADGVRAALNELRRRVPGKRIGVIGVSLGAASLVLCHNCGRVDAIVLESMYPTIEDAVADRLRMRIGALGGPLSVLLLWQSPLRLGIHPDELRPIDRAGFNFRPACARRMQAARQPAWRCAMRRGRQRTAPGWRA